MTIAVAVDVMVPLEPNVVSLSYACFSYIYFLLFFAVVVDSFRKISVHRGRESSQR